MSLPHGRLSTEEAGHVRKYSADSATDFAVKLEPAWSMEEDSTDQPSAVYSTAQPMSENTSLLSLDSKHQCYLCPAAFVLFSSFELHLASVHGEKLFMVLPGSSTPDRSDAGVCSNIVMDKEVESYRKRKTSNKKVNNNDISNKDGMSRRKQHACDVCSKSFRAPSALKMHKLIHSGVKPFVCDVCNKSFTQSGSLAEHKRTHTGERPSYKCPHCDGSFTRSGHLQLHIKSVHEGHKPHVCDVCGAAFSQNSDLTVHRRAHTGEKTHVCSDCGKSFARSCILAQHRLIHTKEKSHVCSDCGKGFVQSSNLATHRLIHSGEKPHSCPHCPAAFRLSHHLKKHVQKVHQ